MSVRTRRAALTIAAVTAALSVTACSGAASHSSASSDDDTIRIAIVSPHSGPYAEFGAEQRAGFEFAAKEANDAGGVGGRKVELYEADSLGTPDGAVAAAQKLVQQKDAHFIMGTIATTETLAVMQRLHSWDALAFGTQSQGDSLTGSDCTRRFFRTNMSDHIDIQGLKSWLAGEHASDWDSIAADYAFGRDSADGLKTYLKSSGGQVDKDVYAPLGTTDYAPYINKLDGGGALLVSLSGGDSVNFLKQALQFGTLKKYKLVVGNTALTTSSLNAVKDDRLLGYYGTANWGPTANIPETKKFVTDYTKAQGETPADFTGAAYLAMQTLFAGIEKADTVDPTSVAKSLEGLTYDSIKGHVTMRTEDHQLEAPVFVGKVIKTGSAYDLGIEKAIPMSETMPDPDPTCKMGDF